VTMMKKLFAGSAAVAALATAAPAAAQYGYGYAYGNPYGAAPAYGYNAYGANAATAAAAQRCSAAVQSRLQTRQGLPGVIASLLGAPTVSPRIVSITQVTPRRDTVRVRGLASTGRFAGGYGPYGVGAYGAVGYAYQPDLSFSCSVDYRGYVRDIDINRR